jgi:ribosomal 30S subunit maturation factor RimM
METHSQIEHMVQDNGQHLYGNVYSIMHFQPYSLLVITINLITIEGSIVTLLFTFKAV